MYTLVIACCMWSHFGNCKKKSRQSELCPLVTVKVLKSDSSKKLVLNMLNTVNTTWPEIIYLTHANEITLLHPYREMFRLLFFSKMQDWHLSIRHNCSPSGLFGDPECTFGKRRVSRYFIHTPPYITLEWVKTNNQLVLQLLSIYLDYCLLPVGTLPTDCGI